MSEDELREKAVKRIKDKRDFWTHFAAYVLVNAMLVGIWALSGGGYFWPAWVLLGWGIGLFFHGLAIIIEGRPIREDQIEREMRHLKGT